MQTKTRDEILSKIVRVVNKELQLNISNPKEEESFFLISRNCYT